MSFVIYVRNPGTNELVFIKTYEGDSEDDMMATERIAEYNTYDEAMKVADGIRVCQAWGYDIVELP